MKYEEVDPENAPDLEDLDEEPSSTSVYAGGGDEGVDVMLKVGA